MRRKSGRLPVVLATRPFRSPHGGRPERFVRIRTMHARRSMRCFHGFARVLSPPNCTCPRPWRYMPSERDATLLEELAAWRETNSPTPWHRTHWAMTRTLANEALGRSKFARIVRSRCRRPQGAGSGPFCCASARTSGKGRTAGAASARVGRDRPPSANRPPDRARDSNCENGRRRFFKSPHRGAARIERTHG